MFHRAKGLHQHALLAHRAGLASEARPQLFRKPKPANMNEDE
jgi:hypothetical protein